MSTPLLLIIGLIILVFGIIQLLKTMKLVKNGIKMEAAITDVKKKKSTSQDEDGYTSTTDMYYPVFSYTYNGEEYTKESFVGVSNSRKYKVGNMIKIVFLGDNPEKAKVHSVFNLWFIPVGLLLLSVVFFISAFVS
jgi:hypothetical protein